MTRSESDVWREVRRPAVVLGLLLAVSCVAGEPADPGPAEASAYAAPADVDLRPAFAKLGLAVRSQGARPTCSVFAVTGALEYALARRTGEARALSVEFVNWAADEATGECEDGSFFSDLWTGFAARGICDEADDPYRAAFDPAHRPSEEALARARARRDAGLAMHWIKEWNVDTGLTEAEFLGVKRALESGWPVCGGFRWPKKATWTAGVLDMAPPEGVRDGHSVLIVGYVDDPSLPGGGAFLLHDSGRARRGDAMNYAYARQYMNDALWIDCPTPRR